MTTTHILITTDFSEGSLRAVAPAKELAAVTGARLTVLHIVHTYAIRPVGAPLAPPMTLPVDADALANAKRLLKSWTEEHFQGTNVDAVCTVGSDIASTVAEQARTLGCDLIVMSTHGRSGLEHFFLGSVTERVLRMVHAPVLCIPPDSGS